MRTHEHDRAGNSPEETEANERMAVNMKLDELREAYKRRTSLAVAMTDDADDTTSDAWRAIRAVLKGGAPMTLASRLYFRSGIGRPLFTIRISRYGAVQSVQVGEGDGTE